MRVDELRSDLMNSSTTVSTKVNYRWQLKKFQTWCCEDDIQSVDDRLVSIYLTDMFARGYAPGTIALAMHAIAYQAREHNQRSPIGDQSRTVLRGINREGRDRGRGQSEGLTYKQFNRLLDHVFEPRFRETTERAMERGLLDRAIISLLFMAGMRRSEVVRLIWHDIDFKHPKFVYVTVSHSKANQSGDREDIRVISKRGAQALRDLRHHRSFEPSNARIVPYTTNTVNARFQACCRSIGLQGKYTSHSGRIGLASELCARGAPAQAVAIAGGWKSLHMVTHYSKKTELERGAVATYL